MPGPLRDPRRLWLVRHGETEWSAGGRHTGRTDVALTADGEAAARALAPTLDATRFARVLSSPLRRARDTARLAGFPDVEIDDDLAEWDYGGDEGLTTAEIREQRPGWTVWADGPRDGETAVGVAARADRVIARARAQDTGDDPEGPVLAFCHGHLARMLGARWIGLEPSGGAHLQLSTAAVCILGWDRETPAIELWNAASPPG